MSAIWLTTAALAQGIALEDASDLVPATVGSVGGLGDKVHGVAWLDFDLDGDLDLLHTNGPGLPTLLFRNQGDGSFVEVAEQAGVAVRTGAGGVLAADLDGDGATDLLLLGDNNYYGYVPTPAYLFHNRGDGTFTDVTESSGLRDALPPTATFATAGDIDGDGDLDVFVGSAGALKFERQDPNALLLNQGGRFVDVAPELGLDRGTGACAGSFVHLDDDALIDLFVASCAEVTYAANPLQVFFQQPDGTFRDERVERKVWALGWWMSATTGDFDGDLQLDLFSTNIGPPRDPGALYLSRPDGTWEERAQPAGLEPLAFGWGASAVDLDNDGLLDLYYVGSPVTYDRLAYSAPGYALRNLGDGTFSIDVQPFDLSRIPTSGLAAADYDDDGLVDLAVGSARVPRTHAPSHPILLHNVGPADRHWLTIELRDLAPNLAAVGATIYVTAPGRVPMRRDVVAGASFLSTESPWPSFGLDDADRAHVLVRWPDGTREDFGEVDADQRLVLSRGQAPAPRSRRSSGCGG